MTDVFARLDGLSGDTISALFEDREGDIWVATTDGLDRFREAAVASFSVNQGLSSDRVASVLTSDAGSAWFGTNEGLDRWTGGQVTVYRERSAPTTPGRGPYASRKAHEVTGPGMPAAGVQSIFQDSRGRVWLSTRRGVGYLENDRFVPVDGIPGGLTRAIAEDNRGNLWIAKPASGLFRLSSGSGAIDQIPWGRLNHNDPVTAMAVDPSQGGLWFGFFQGGLAYFADGQLRSSLAAANGLAEGRVSAIQPGHDGTLWVAATGGLSRLKDGRVATLTSRDGLPCDSIGWVVEDDAHSLWLGMCGGLVEIKREEIDSWAAERDRGGNDAKRLIRATVFDTSDGVRTWVNASYYSAPAAKASDGKVWFMSPDGVSVVDPRHLPFNALPPPVHIEQVIADHKTYAVASDANGGVSLPALTRDLKLEGFDRDWQDVGNRRQAFYTNLPPGDYRLRVIAANNSGVWNETGATLDFAIAPAYYQATWFRTAVVVAFFALLAALYQLRLRRLAWQFNMRLEERVNERTRIARDLHDTLLQSFHAVMLRFHAATFLLPDRPEDARRTLEDVLGQAEQAVREGRDAVQGLRDSTTAAEGLTEGMRTLGESLVADHAAHGSLDFGMNVEGSPRTLAPLVQDDVYRIAGEALRNAFRHAHARRIEIEIRYDERELRLRVRDDGKGIDGAAFDGAQLGGHWGLTGMRERAKLIGGTLDVWSEHDSGTEVELRIPGKIAYARG